MNGIKVGHAAVLGCDRAGICSAHACAREVADSMMLNRQAPADSSHWPQPGHTVYYLALLLECSSTVWGTYWWGLVVQAALVGKAIWVLCGGLGGGEPPLGQQVQHAPVLLVDACSCDASLHFQGH